MTIKLICVGKIKEKYLKAGIEEYQKRLSAYCKLKIIEVADEKIPDNPSLSQQIMIKNKEGEKILKYIKDNKDYMILMDVKSKTYDSVQFSEMIENQMINGYSTIVFVIGGSLGHSEELYHRAQIKVSVSPMTFPHQLFRLILVEQIYRSFKIINHETYHK